MGEVSATAADDGQGQQRAKHATNTCCAAITWRSITSGSILDHHELRIDGCVSGAHRGSKPATKKTTSKGSPG